MGIYDAMQISVAAQCFIERIKNNSVRKECSRRVLTGFNELDSAISGLYPGGLYILGARPSMGKTSFALDIAKNIGIEDKKSVCIFSLDLSAAQLAGRMLSKLGKIHMSDLFGNTADKKALSGALDLLSESKIFINDRCRTIDEFRKVIEEIARVDLVIIDYFQLMGVDSCGSTPEYCHLLTMLKELAIGLEVPILVCSQLNRTPEMRKDHRPRISDLRFVKSCDAADAVMLLYRDGYYYRDSEDKSTEIIIAKNKQGAVGTVRVVREDESGF